MTFTYDGPVVTIKDDSGAIVVVGMVTDMKKFSEAAHSSSGIAFAYVSNLRIFVRNGEGRCLVVMEACEYCGVPMAKGW